MAGDTIDDIGDTFATVDGWASRKRNLLEGPKSSTVFELIGSSQSKSELGEQQFGHPGSHAIRQHSQSHADPVN